MNGSMTMLFLYAFVIVAGATNGIASSQLATNSSEIGIGLPHYIARAGSALIPLTTEMATVRTRSRALGFGGSRTEAELDGGKSTLRIENPTPEFILRGVDATRFKLYRFEMDDEKRTLEIAAAGPLNSTMTLQESEIPVSIVDCGTSCFRLSVQMPLSSGEYGFSPVDTNESFTFGIDNVPSVSESQGFIIPAVSNEVLTNEDVVALKRAGLSDNLISAKIRTSDSNFNLTAEDIIALRTANISETVILLMLEVSPEN